MMDEVERHLGPLEATMGKAARRPDDPLLV